MNPNEDDEMRKNERILAKSKQRKVSKQFQKMQHPTVTYFLNELQKHNRSLTGVSESNELRLAFSEIKEQIEKAGNGLSFSELKWFIEETVDEKLQVANRKLEYCANSINEFRREFNDLYLSTINALKSINAEMKVMMSVTESEIRKAIKMISYKRKVIDYDKVSSDIKKKSSTKLFRVLSVICAFETIFYCISFSV